MSTLWQAIRGISLFIVASLASNARADELDPRTFENIHSSQYAQFSHWSAVIEYPDRLQVEYAVCNLSHNDGLIFEWVEPNITVGDGGRLPGGKCYILKREITSVEHGRNSTIRFTQASRRHTAPAHLPSLPLSLGNLPSFISNQLRTFIKPPASGATLADFNNIEIRRDGSVEYRITWYPPTVTVALSGGVFSEEARAPAVEGLQEAGLSTQISTLGDYLADSDTSYLDEERLAADAVFLTNSDRLNRSFRVTVPRETFGIGNASVTLIDGETRTMITDFQISTYTP
ncbi:MAG: hypothetical protein NXI27_20975 [Alphaproteobacteria bacterium]|nr:hypothetical protein [Alphaproteobacteria bacterium]